MRRLIPQVFGVRRPQINVLAATTGMLLMMLAATYSLAPVTSGDYRGALRSAPICATGAVACLAVPAAQRPRPWRVAAVVLASPALFVLVDVCDRWPSVFGGR